jgi:purine-binding chemotaxis protein CheW
MNSSIQTVLGTVDQNQSALSSKLEVVAFHVGDEEFCIDIMAVREIRGWTQATALPHVPSYVRGVINLRGTVLPVIDLAVRFGGNSSKASARDVVIVTQVGTQLVGLLVDGVSDILTISKSSIQPTPNVASELAETFVKGLIALDGRMISVIDLQDVLPNTMREQSAPAPV